MAYNLFWNVCPVNQIKSTVFIHLNLYHEASPTVHVSKELSEPTCQTHTSLTSKHSSTLLFEMAKLTALCHECHFLLGKWNMTIPSSFLVLWIHELTGMKPCWVYLLYLNYCKTWDVTCQLGSVSLIFTLARTITQAKLFNHSVIRLHKRQEHVRAAFHHLVR